MKYLNAINETARALGFLSRLSIPDRYFKGMKPENTSHCAGFYPVAGLVIAMPTALTFLVSSALGLPPQLSAALGVLTLIAITGALHEDGFGDVADGFGGGATVEQRLEIMKDSRLGTYGVIAVMASLFLRITALGAIIDFGGASAGIFAIFASAAASRGAMVWFWASLPNARIDGVSSKVGAPPENAVSLAAIFGLSLAAFFGVIASGFIAASIAIGLSLLAMMGFQKMCMRMINGQTGDTIGAVQQLTEISMLVGLAIQVSMST